MNVAGSRRMLLMCCPAICTWHSGPFPTLQIFMPRAAFSSSLLCFLGHRFKVGNTVMGESWKWESNFFGKTSKYYTKNISRTWFFDGGKSYESWIIRTVKCCEKKCYAGMPAVLLNNLNQSSVIFSLHFNSSCTTLQPTLTSTLDVRRF